MNIPALKEIVEERKEKAIESLSGSFAKNRLPLEEYERLVEYINKIESERELVVVEKIVAEYGRSDNDERTARRYDDDDDDEDEENSVFGMRNNSNFNGNLTILSSRTITGPVKSGSQLISILGSGRIKIRRKDLSKRKTVLNLFSLLGEYTILVEPGIKVTNKAIPILGSAGTDRKVSKEALDGDFELIISGAVLLGEIKVKLLKD